ncbi:MAG TPA: hypothetical protein VFF69_01610 [Phycisphaerales bacterium]|nr:hypothetical protein [Phycisphaerales bacterium]
MSMSNLRSWWSDRRGGGEPERRASGPSAAAVHAAAGRASDASFEVLEGRVLLSDPGSTFNDAQELVLDGDGQATYDDMLPDTSDVDMYTFSVSAPDFITVLADAVNTADAFDDRVDTRVQVYDYQGNLVGFSGDSGKLTGGTPIDAWFGFVPTAAHRNSNTGLYTYFVRVTAQAGPQNAAQGLYTIRVDGQSTEISHDGSPDESTTDGTIGRPLEDIVYRVETGDDDAWDSLASANARADDDDLDTRLDIYDSEGNLVVGDSQSGRLTNAFTVFKSNPDETFYIRVRSDEFEPATPRTGDFQLALDLVGQGIPLDPVSRVGYVTGAAGEDVTDLFQFVAQSSGPAIIQATPLPGLTPGLLDPSITLYDSDGTFIAFSDRFFGDSPQIESTLVGGETYYVLVDGFDFANTDNFHMLVEAAHTFQEGDTEFDDHANSLDFARATPIVWSDWQVAEENTLAAAMLAQGPLSDHSLVSIGAASGRIHRGSDTDVFVFVPPVDMLGNYAGNIGDEVDEDMDGLVDRDGDAAQDGAAIGWYEGYRPASRVEIQVQAIEDPGAPPLTWLTPGVRVYDSVGTIVYEALPDMFDDAFGLDFTGSLDPARYYADLDFGALGIDYAEGATPFEGVFSLSVWGGEPYYIEVFGTSGSGRYNAFVSVDGFPDPSDEDNWSTIQSDTPLADDSFDGIADDTGTRTVSGFIEAPNNFNNAPIDFANAWQIDLGVGSGAWAGPTGSSDAYLDSSALMERAFVMGLADYPTPWTFPFSIADAFGATLLTGYDDDNAMMGAQYDNTGVTVLRESGIAGIEHPLDNDLYTFRAAATGYAEIRINTTQLSDWFEEWIADGAGPLVDASIAEEFGDDEDDDGDNDDGDTVGDGDSHNEDEGDDPFDRYDDLGWYLDDDGEPAGDFVTPQNFSATKIYNSILDSALRIFNNDFEQVGYNNDNNSIPGETDTTYAGANGERTFHKRDAYISFPIVKGEVYYIQVESGQAGQYEAWRDDPTMAVAWQHLIGSYELLVHTVPTLTNDDFVNASTTDATVLGIDEATGIATISGEIDNNISNPLDADLFAFISPATAEMTITVGRQSGETLIPDVVIYRENELGNIEQLASGTASSDGSITITTQATKGERYFIQVFGAGASEGLYDVTVSGLTVEDDHADWLEFQGATEVELLDFLGSASAEGSIEGNGDTDVFRFRAGDFTDATITVQAETLGFNPFVEVYEVSVDPLGNPVLLRLNFNDDYTDSADAQVTIGLTPNRISDITGLEYPFYYVVVRASEIQTDEGDYTVEFDITKTDDHPDVGQFQYATAIAVDNEFGQGSDTGTIEIVGDSDLFRFTALAGGIGRITVSRPTGSDFLPKVTLLDSEGNVLDVSDGITPGIVESSITRGLVYFVLVEASSLASGDSETGDYTVALAAPPLDDYPNAGEWSIAHSIALDPTTGDGGLGTDTLGDPLNPRIDVVNDTDLFTFRTIAAGNVTITFAPLDDSALGLRPELTIFDADHNEVETISSFTPGDPISIVLTGTTADQRYFVLVNDLVGNRTGEYQVAIEGNAGSDGGGGGIGDIDFDDAEEVALDPINADGTASGVISQAGERDLFAFTAPAGGTIYVQLTTPRGSLLDATITILDAASEEAVVSFDATGIPGVNAAVRFASAGEGQQYYVVVDGIGTGVGSYTLTIDAEPEVYRVFYPAGFTGPTIREFVSVANPNNFDITYSVILHYETGERDQVVLSNATLEAGSRGGVTISNGAEGSPVGARIAPYSIEVRAVGGPIGASMGHFDFGATTGDAFTNQISPLWSFARLERNSGIVNDFLLYFNPHDFDVEITLTAYDAAGEEIEITQTVGALRRGGLNLDQVLELPTGVFGGVVTAAPVDAANNGEFLGIVAGHSHYELVDGSGFGIVGDPAGGGLAGATPSLVQGAGADSEVVIFNPNPFVSTITLHGQYVRTDLPDFTQTFTVPARGTLVLSGTDLGFISEQPLGINFTSNFPVTVMGNQAQFGDADGAAGATQAGTGWFFGAAFINSDLAGDQYFETLSL